MKKWIVIFLPLIAVYLLVKSASAVTTIDFDDVTSKTKIDDYYSGLGVLFSTSGLSAYSDGSAYARSSSKSISSPNVIGGDKSGYTYLNDVNITGIVEFINLANLVEIWATPYGSQNLSAWMKVYDSSGYLLDTINVNGSTPGGAELLSITWPQWEIAKVEFSGANSRAAFDNFSFNVVPEPISSILFITGGATLVAGRYWRKRKRRVL